MKNKDKNSPGRIIEANKVTIVAEIGSNYNNDLDLAKKYVRAAKKSGADVVKFQTLKKEKLIAPRVFINGKKTDHPVWTTFGNLELLDSWHFELKKISDEIGIEFLSTPFYLEAVDLLEKVGVSRYKIASGDITFTPLLEAIGKTGKPVILSTGASSLKEVDSAIKTIMRSGVLEITLLHCVSSYPPHFQEINLRAMLTLKKVFGLPVGISDHSPGDLIAIAATTLGAAVIEKHVTLDRNMEGPDHPYAMTIEEFGDMVQRIRLLEESMGNGEKVPSKDEMSRQHRIRRGVYDPISKEPIEGSDGIWLRPQHHIPF